MTWVNAVVQGVLLGGLYALFACGLSLLFGVMRIINLAHGDLALLGTFMVFAVVDNTGWSPFAALTSCCRAPRSSAGPCSGSCSTVPCAAASSRRCWPRSACRS